MLVGTYGAAHYIGVEGDGKNLDNKSHIAAITVHVMSQFGLCVGLIISWKDQTLVTVEVEIMAD